ncbi:hypothetical protein [Bradyrhizobium monzae]|uniref:hypothetical protein n=1 Tax=Bradyrhizobium sp. Oc8 TaxID=2876780 RepID=UPI001F3FB862|nr:hypothetical protein [Bradyrhizobium sp. Oc8]
MAARIVAPRPNITAGRSEFVYTRLMVGLPQGDSPLLLNASYTVTADVDVPQGGAEGMILTCPLVAAYLTSSWVSSCVTEVGPNSKHCCG